MSLLVDFFSSELIGEGSVLLEKVDVCFPRPIFSCQPSMRYKILRLYGTCQVNSDLMHFYESHLSEILIS